MDQSLNKYPGNFETAKPTLRPIVVVIPVCGYSGILRDVVSRTLSISRAVMVVDDGSTENGVAALEDLGMMIVCVPAKSGKGAAILTAAREARRLGMTHIVTIDADGQYDPSDFKWFMPVLEGTPEAIVVGKRVFQETKTGRPRFSRVFSGFLFRVQTGKSLKDTQCGFRAYPVQMLENLRLCGWRYAFEMEVLVKAAWAGVELREVDVSFTCPSHSARASGFRIFKEYFQIAFLNFHFAMRSVTPLPHRKIVGNATSPGEKISVLHPLRSLKTLLTENTSLEQLAAAGALGVFLGTLPLIGCHTIAILFFARYLRLNRVTSVTTSQLCMPPLVPALCIETGYFIRHGRFLTEVSIETLGYQALERAYEWVLGALVLAPVLAVFIGAIIYLMGVFTKRVRRDQKENA